MKFRTTLFFLAVAGIAFAQKKEMRKIDNAISSLDFAKAQEIFNTIDPNAVEDKYKASYSFYKAAATIDLTGKRKANLNQLRAAEEAFAKAQELGYSEKEYTVVLSNFINARKFALANESLAAGDREVAYTLVNELYEANPSNLEMLYNSANLAYSLKKYDEALKQYQMLLDEDYTGVTTSYVATNSSNQQVEAFPSKQVRDLAVTSGSHIKPEEQTSSSNLGDVLLKTVWLYKNAGDQDKAVSVFEKTLEENPTDQSVIAAKSEIYLTLEMMDAYQKALGNNEIKDPRVYDNLANAAFEKKEYDQAVQYYERSLSMDAANYPALVNVSNAYLEKGNLKTTAPKDQRAYYLKAIDYLEKALVLKPNEKGVMQTLLSLYNAFKMDDKAAALQSKM